MLDGAGDTQGDIDLGMDGLTGLADLMVSSDPAGVHAGTGGAHDAAQDLSQLLSQLDAALDILADATAHGHDEVGTDQVHQLLGSLDGLHHLGLDVAGRQLESGMQDLNLLGAVGAELTLLHNAGAHGGHGGAEAGAEDGGHQVAAESGTGHLDVTGDIVILTVDLHGTQLLDTLLSQRGSLTQEVLVDGHIDVQMGAVGAQTGVQASCAAGGQITADIGSAEQQDLGLDLLHGIGDDLGVGIGGVVLQQGAVVDIDLVGTVAAQLLGDAVHVVAQQNAAQLNAQFVSQLPTLGDQFKGSGHHLALTLLAENPDVFEGSGISTIKSHFLISFLR